MTPPTASIDAILTGDEGTGWAVDDVLLVDCDRTKEVRWNL